MTMTLKELKLDATPLGKDSSLIRRELNRYVDDIHLLTGYDKTLILNVLKSLRLVILEDLASKMPDEVVKPGTNIRIGLPDIGDLIIPYRRNKHIKPVIVLYDRMYNDIVKAIYDQDTPLLNIIEPNVNSLIEDRYANFVDDKSTS